MLPILLPVFSFPVLARTGGSRPSASTPASRAPPLSAPRSSSLSAPLPFSASGTSAAEQNCMYLFSNDHGTVCACC